MNSMKKANGQKCSTHCQAAVEAFAASLGATSNTSAAQGTPGTSSRAELVKQIPESEWEEARVLLRTQGDLLMVRLHAARAKRRDTACYLLAGDYTGFHHRPGD
jgi:hypothetical protein